MAHDVFISYSSTDQPAALAVLHGLEAAGIRCWIAPRDIKPGAIWAQSIMDGIAGARILVVVFSANANRSTHVINEVDAAVRKGAVVLPFRIEDVMPDGAMEYHLRTRHWLDALTPDLERHTAQLADQVRLLLDAPSPGTPTPPPRPMPSGLPPRGTTPPAPPKPTRPFPWRRWRWPIAAGIITLLLGGWWLFRPKPVGGVTFRVKEISGSGGNEMTVRMTSGELRFFEGPGNVPALSSRSYQRTFMQANVRYLYPEVHLLYESPGKDLVVPIACNVIGKEDQVYAAISVVARITGSWTGSYHTQGWGNERGGTWAPGRYRVDCSYGDKLIARDWFTIAAASATERATLPAMADAPLAEAPVLAALGARVAEVKLFRTGFRLPPEDQRAPTTTFDAATTTYIGAQVTLQHEPPDRPTRATLTCRFLLDRTQEVLRAQLPFTMQPNYRSSWSAVTRGRDEPGWWRPGDYTLACDDGKRTLTQIGFTVR